MKGSGRRPCIIAYRAVLAELILGQRTYYPQDAYWPISITCLKNHLLFFHVRVIFAEPEEVRFQQITEHLGNFLKKVLVGIAKVIDAVPRGGSNNLSFSPS